MPIEYQFGPYRIAMNISPDLTESQQTVSISSQILQSPNIDPSSSMELSNDLKINERVGVKGGIDSIEIRTLTIPLS